MTELKQSGDNQEFSTGAVRDKAAGKPMPGLISPYATLREADILAKGAVHYGSRNWEAGIPISRCIESLERHIMKYKMGLTDEDHMAQARCNTGFILHFEEMIKKGIIPEEIDDMPKYEQVAHINPLKAFIDGAITEDKLIEIAKGVRDK